MTNFKPGASSESPGAASYPKLTCTAENPTSALHSRIRIRNQVFLFFRFIFCEARTRIGGAFLSHFRVLRVRLSASVFPGSGLSDFGVHGGLGRADQCAPDSDNGLAGKRKSAKNGDVEQDSNRIKGLKVDYFLESRYS